MKNNEYTLDELILKYINLKASKKYDNEYTLDELISMRNKITKYYQSLSHCNDTNTIIKAAIREEYFLYLNRLDEIILKKISEDNKNDNFANYGLH